MHIYTYICTCMWREGREEAGVRRDQEGSRGVRRGQGEIAGGNGVEADGQGWFMLNPGLPDCIPYSVKSFRQTFSPWG